jgi:hypothetical protein
MTLEQLSLEASAESLIAECLKDLDDIEADYIRECCLAAPRMTHRAFSEQWGLVGNDVTEVKRRALTSLQRALRERKIYSISKLL